MNKRVVKVVVGWIGILILILLSYTTVIPVFAAEEDSGVMRLVMHPGQQEAIYAEVLPEDAKNKELIWSSSNKEVADVDEGIVTAVAKGEAEISAASKEDGTIIAKLFVIVKNVAVESLTLDINNLSLYEGESEQIIATILPANATVKAVAFESQDPGIATVDDAGKVTATGVGTTTIKVWAKDDPAISTTCTVTVQKKPTISGIVLSWYLAVGEKKTLKAVLADPDSAAELTWESSDTNILTVEAGLVTALKEGEAVISVSSNEKLIASCKVTVISKQELQEILSLSFQVNNFSMKPGETETLVPIFEPESATNKELIWKSTSSCVSVEKGVVKAITAGKATITATTLDGEHSAKCEIIVSGASSSPSTGTPSIVSYFPYYPSVPYISTDANKAENESNNPDEGTGAQSTDSETTSGVSNASEDESRLTAFQKKTIKKIRGMKTKFTKLKVKKPI